MSGRRGTIMSRRNFKTFMSIDAGTGLIAHARKGKTAVPYESEKTNPFFGPFYEACYKPINLQ
jgi:hypothetical protein